MKKSFGTTLLAASLALIAGLSLAPTDKADAAHPLDGSSSDRAAASCYEIKLTNPASTSGTYWLYTPQMDAPAQFYCDQETDGGGWVLVGRGREGWTEQYAGQGQPEELALNPDGTDAFAPVQLPAKTVDALLNNQPLSQALPEGIRLRRALVPSGLEWQEVRSRRVNGESWSWSLGAPSYWTDTTFIAYRWFGAITRAGLPSRLGRMINYGSTFDHVSFEGRTQNRWRLGFSYGSMVTGVDSPTSYLWGKEPGYATPFTQLYIRPRLTQENLLFPAIGDEGLAASSRRALPQSISEPVVWRTSDRNTSDRPYELNTYVQAITESQGTVFIGGDHPYIESAQGEVVEQPYLSGYRVGDAELVRSFRPQLNGQVKALETLPNGTLVVGGEFTQVNGEVAEGLVLLDPVTGEIDRSWTLTLENRLLEYPTASIRSLDVQGNYLYIAGAFTHLATENNPHKLYARNAARIDLRTGQVDASWRPTFNGSINGISASEDGQRVYLAGYFSQVMSANVESVRLAALNTTDAQPLAPWEWERSNKTDTRRNAGFQFDVQATEASVFAAGSEHLIAKYQAETLAREASAIAYSGGDFQDLHLNQGIIYGACHCGDWIYEGSGETFSTPWVDVQEIHKISLLGAFDAASGRYLPEFNPQMKGKSGHGIWESFVDSSGVLWVGGDINSTVGAEGAQPTVGFARFAPRDVIAPSAPSAPEISFSEGLDQLSWEPSAEKGVTYQVLRNDRVIASTQETSYEVAHLDQARYFVRAVDAAGNYSATTAVFTLPEDFVAPAPEPVEAEPVEEKPAIPLVSSGEVWSYYNSFAAPPSNWNQLEADSSQWLQEKTPLGAGTFHPSMKVNQLAKPDLPPMTVYARKELELEQVDQFTSLKLTTYADDGLVVYVNGREVGRENMFPGTPYHDMMALSYVDTLAELPREVTFDVPLDYLVEGKNLIAVEIHGVYRLTPNLSFDLTAEAR